ncbi:outer membrane lipoprotein-sorting protein [Aestuariispira insulae]|uniref:Outer membrane lipoprotein-sorting protein n=1 Tax=Aestuariispira insulae TaxID=1461337 RepID=A0A3D9HF95_9PROT|nr:outer membrane lipoprotein-sorting protein [Aestuariispira insulae]RED48154.1 outer membrane lipoprotein-sorting protein [Aestuariispira insulae]
MKKIILSTVTAAWVAGGVGVGLYAPAALADDAADKGRAIAEEWDRRDLGFGDTKAKLRMVLQNRHGETSEREMYINTLEVPGEGDGDKSLVYFEHPRDIKGTALLSYAHILDPDDQWLYLPKLKRVKRISSTNKSGPFVGSEFAFEDISAQELGKYTYKWLRDEPCGELTCAVLEQTPLYENSGYTKQVTWYDLSEYRQQKVEYYDRKGELLKTLEFRDYQQYLGKYWRADELFMTNHQTGKKTSLVYESYEFQTGLSEGDFRKNTLKRLQ